MGVKHCRIFHFMFICVSGIYTRGSGERFSGYDYEYLVSKFVGHLQEKYKASERSEFYG